MRAKQNNIVLKCFEHVIGMNASACAASYELKDHSFHAAEVLASVCGVVT